MHPNVPFTSPLTKVFTAEASTFSMEAEPSSPPECLLQIVLNHIFIPLSMLMTDSLNRIETNQNVKYKHINYRSGVGKHFLDEASFASKDDPNDFEFGQIYTTWLTLIEVVSDPDMEHGWHPHHKHMILDREFLDWAQAWHTHDCMLHTRFMLKPCVLDVSSLAYEEQFKKCKLNQALLGNHGSSHDCMHQGLCPMDSSTNPTDSNTNQVNSLLTLPCYMPYPKKNKKILFLS